MPLFQPSQMGPCALGNYRPQGRQGRAFAVQRQPTWKLHSVDWSHDLAPLHQRPNRSGSHRLKPGHHVMMTSAISNSPRNGSVAR